jgi:hypothetical protein
MQIRSEKMFDNIQTYEAFKGQLINLGALCLGEVVYWSDEVTVLAAGESEADNAANLHFFNHYMTT